MVVLPRTQPGMCMLYEDREMQLGRPALSQCDLDL